MTVKCSLCGQGFLSLLVEREKAIAEVSEAFVKHLTSEHLVHLQMLSRDLNLLLGLATWFVSVQLLIVDDGEKQWHEQYIKQGKKILKLIGLDASQIQAVDVKHKVKTLDDVPEVKMPGTIVTQ